MADKDEQLINLLEDTDEHPIDLTSNERPAAQPSAPPSEVPNPVGPEESPPPYSTFEIGSPASIKCQVCQAVINIEGNQQNAVKCQECKESTAVKAAPRGMKFVRCPCNCLIVCKATSRRVRCPRQNCKRELNLTGVGFDVSVTRPAQNKIRLECGYCHGVFVAAEGMMTACPHCRATSYSKSGIRLRYMIYLLLGLVFLGAGTGVTVGTYEAASRHGGIYVIWIGAFITGLLLLFRAASVASLKSSKVIGPVL